MAGAMEKDSDGKINRYSSLRPIFSLNILGHTHFQDDDALRIFELYDPAREKRFNKRLIQIGYFELTKRNIGTTNQKHWHVYFTTGEAGPDAPEYIKKASQIIDYVNLGREEKELVEVLEKAQAIYEAEMVSSFIEGKEEKAVEVAKAMLKKGLSLEIIVECTGLPLNVIKIL
jgi:hypothetical protein